MISRIIDVWNKSDYDFRERANAKDELAHLFDDWVSYYRLKWAIAKVISPKSILEIGVRYGYSAQAFLSAAPTAKYVGIDIDSNLNGGEPGALNWARDSLNQYNIDILKDDSQKMSRFPGKMYDLIHVDGQQDGDSSYWDLSKALKQAKYILVDGYFWSSENKNATDAFLEDNKERIEFFFVIPGYAGELLIKVKVDSSAPLTHTGEHIKSNAIRNQYDEKYYLSDCGGYVEYKKSSGRDISADFRLDAVFRIASITQGMHVIDAGAGRGEITFACAAAGASVESIDYSESAIKLAKSCFDGHEKLLTEVEFFCTDINSHQFTSAPDRVIASDLIEHMSPVELDLMYEKISKSLNRDGQFVIHTFPNLWFYQYGYKAQRKKKSKFGIYTSPEPRTHYERLMHINEQSPRVLRDQLSRHFKFVLVWFGTHGDSVSSLNRTYKKSDCMNATSIYAVASNDKIDIDKIKNEFVQNPLTEECASLISLELLDSSSISSTSEAITASIKITNQNNFTIKSVLPNPIHLSYHWYDKDGNVLLHNCERTKLPVIGPKSSDLVNIDIEKLSHDGELSLYLCLVQEGVFWFEDFNKEHGIMIDFSE